VDFMGEKWRKGWVAPVIFFCFLLSGLSSLIYEVLWMRMLILIFGSTTFAISTVLTAFMGGLALGSFIFGRLIDRSRHPVPIYGAIEAGIGVYALLVPAIFSSLIPLYRQVWQSLHISFYLFSVMQFVLVTLVLIVPTTLMGATLPILSKYYSDRKDRLGWTIGTLYAMNTLGGILGTFLSGFFLLPALGVRMTTFLAASLNLLIGFIVLLLVKTGDVQDKVRPQVGKNISRSFEGEPLSRAALRLVLVGFGLSGFASMVYEVTWSRVLAMILDSSTYAFTIMLTTFLVGIALGSFLMSRAADRLRRPLLTFILLEGAIGASSFVGLFLFAELPYLFLVLYRSFSDSLNLIFFSKFLLAFAVMFLPTLLIGALFPLVVRIYTPNLDRVGRSIGEVYSLNTLGCILGSFCSGFILVPLLGIQESILLAVGLNVLLASLLLLVSPYGLRTLKTPLAVAFSLSLLAMGLHVPK
jgi:spermidine synthase